MTVIFTTQTSTKDDILTLNADGTLTFTHENDGWAMAKNGLSATSETLTVEQAKQRWPQHAARIDEALRGN